MSIQHITKDTTKRRRFQPPITSFFSASTSTTPTTNVNDDDDYNGATPRVSHYHYSAATFSPTPVVPAKVQSSLLSVGMRVRKSVAEGYKTQKELEKQLAATTTPITTANGTNHAELAPFCGYSKTEDLAVQAFSRPSAMNEHDSVTDENDAYSLPSSSQGSFTSSFNGGQKRSYDSDDMEDDEFEGSYDTSNRTILAPSLGQQRRRFIALKNQNRIAGQSMDVDDFEEASFLRRREDVEMDDY
ncbi:hypothetical protein SI65_05320 [Aspergillus cristatus]|uniref:Uncharacterized protein n=1 Tax=Aspergillus cristatus TaxID=573508 RepID=A0A1E3BCK4_ASPCR|nr:hypothetical protein SI65_05320 [Aspergillus cristatus]